MLPGYKPVTLPVTRQNMMLSQTGRDLCPVHSASLHPKMKMTTNNPHGIQTPVSIGASPVFAAFIHQGPLPVCHSLYNVWQKALRPNCSICSINDSLEKDFWLLQTPQV